MDISSIEEMRSKPVRLWRKLILHYCECHIHWLKVPFTSLISYWVLNLVFSRGERGGGGLIWRVRLFQILSLRSRGALIRSVAIIWSWALIRAFTVINNIIACQQPAQQAHQARNAEKAGRFRSVQSRARLWARLHVGSDVNATYVGMRGVA